MYDGQVPTVLLFGAPGVGKGTQGMILGQIHGFYHLSCGDVFRSLNINSAEGREIYQFSSRGQLVPDELTVRIWTKALHGHIASSSYKPPDEMLVLDGIPRNANQVGMLANTIKVLAIVHLICLDEARMIDRIKRRAIRENRSDDANEDIIRTRFNVYRAESEPVINCYPKEMIKCIDAMQSPPEVLLEVLQYLIPIRNKWLSDLPELPM